MGLLLRPIKYECLLRVLCLVRRPVTTLDCFLLKDNNWAFVAGNQFSSPSQCTTRTTTHYQILVIHSAFNLISDILPRPHQRRLRSYKLLNRTALCELVGDFISLYPGTSRDPIKQHSVPGRDIIQSLLALSYQKRRCFGNLKCFQSCLVIRAI